MGPAHKGIVRHTAQFQQLELQQHLGAMAQVFGRHAGKALELAPRGGQGSRHLTEDGAMPGNHRQRGQPLNQIQRGRHIAEARNVVEFRKHHPETLLPQRIGRNQQPGVRRKQDHRMRIMAWGGMHLPQQATPAVAAARLQQSVDAKGLAQLAGGPVAQAVLVPGSDGLGLSGGNPGVQPGPVALQPGITATVITVQVGVDQQVQGSIAQGAGHQGTGLVGMGLVAAVDQHAGLGIAQQDVVGRQPAALEHGDSIRQGGAVHGREDKGTTAGIVQCPGRPHPGSADVRGLTGDRDGPAAGAKHGAK